ncbi:MAG: 50S ribosomal protein L5 [Myxococcales bacterium]|nr:MAG: 50S ribosomal protein L5 [Myxococcales bacterium]
MPRIKNFYKKEIIPKLKEELGIVNMMQVPSLEKIVLNMGLGEATQNPKALESGVETLRSISGQKPVVTKARKSIATFKLRENMPIGVMVTLRGERMWEFFDRLVNIALPRVRDFRGIQSKFDGKGNCSIGIKEQIIFPEVEYEKVDKVRGLNITMVTSAGEDKAGKILLKYLGVPFRN